MDIHSPTLSNVAQCNQTSGKTDPVLTFNELSMNRPQFSQLLQNMDADAYTIRASVVGISTAYEIVTHGLQVVIIDTREVLSGETGQTSGHLSNALGDGYLDIAKRHNVEGAKIVTESHSWAIRRVGEASRDLGIECEYRLLPAIEISQYDRADSKVKMLKEDVGKGTRTRSRI